MCDKLQLMLERTLDTANDLESIESSDAVPKSLSLGKAVLKTTLQLAYEQASELKKMVNNNKRYDDLPPVVLVRQRRIFNKILTMAEIIPHCYDYIHNRLSVCYKRTIAGGEEFGGVDLRLFAFYDASPRFKVGKRDLYDEEGNYIMPDETALRWGF